MAPLQVGVGGGAKTERAGARPTYEGEREGRGG